MVASDWAGAQPLGPDWSSSQGALNVSGSDWMPDAERVPTAMADMSDLESRLLATKLREQERKMREDGRWLAQEESGMVSWSRNAITRVIIARFDALIKFHNTSTYPPFE